MADDKSVKPAHSVGASSSEGPDGSGLQRDGRLDPWRAAVLALGVAAVIAAFVLWLVPTSRSTTTVAESSTTTVSRSAGPDGTTTVRKTTGTTAPGAARSDVILVALLTFGVGLVLAAGIWDRLQEFSVGGVSIKLVETIVDAPGIALIDAVAAGVAAPMSTSFTNIARGVDSTARRRLGLVRVDLKDGKLWAPLNLSPDHSWVG